MASRETWTHSHESAVCILCGAPARRSRYGTHGWKCECSGRRRNYAVLGSLYYLLELENVFPHELKLKISDYLVSLRLGPGDCHVLKKEDINLATGDLIR